MELGQVLAVLRKPRDEAQLTQVIAAVAGSDGAFASALAGVLLAAAPNVDAARSLGAPPAVLRCRPEVAVFDAAGGDRGRVDLVFDDGSDFCLFVELKLGSGYGLQQLERYGEALAVAPGPRRGLLAVTTTTPLVGEDDVAHRPGWLGSIRWHALYEQLCSLEHRDDAVQRVWRTWLALLREQGDFGPMDFDPDDVRGWAKRERAEDFLFSMLNELARPVEATLRELVGAAVLLTRGKHASSVVHPWKNQPNVQFAVPAQVQEPRFRIQFLASDGEPYFTVEARYEHPKESLTGDEAVSAATAFLCKAGFAHRSDGYGYSWARVEGASSWLHEGPATADTLLGIAREAIVTLAESGIFEALAERSPRTPAEPGPPDDA